jgi:hypothetical protein
LGLATFLYSTCLFGISLVLASFGATTSFTSFLVFYYYLGFSCFAIDFVSFLLLAVTSYFVYFFSGALLSFLTSFSCGLASFGFYFLSPAFLSSFFSYFLSLALTYGFSVALGSLVSFSIDPFASFLGYSFAFF